MSDTPRLTAVYASIVHRMSREEYAHARGLADKIRAAAATGDLNAEEYGSHQNVLDAADLIDPTGGIEVITRDELIKLIAGGATCGGHYNCGPMDGDLREAADLLDAFLLNPDAATPDRPGAGTNDADHPYVTNAQMQEAARALGLDPYYVRHFQVDVTDGVIVVTYQTSDGKWLAADGYGAVATARHIPVGPDLPKDQG